MARVAPLGMGMLLSGRVLSQHAQCPQFSFLTLGKRKLCLIYSYFKFHSLAAAVFGFWFWFFCFEIGSLFEALTGIQLDMQTKLRQLSHLCFLSAGVLGVRVPLCLAWNCVLNDSQHFFLRERHIRAVFQKEHRTRVNKSHMIITWIYFRKGKEYFPVSKFTKVDYRRYEKFHHRRLCS